MLKATLLSLLWPGAGHALLARRGYGTGISAALFAVGFLLCAGGSLVHFASGIGLFASYRGSFFVGVLLRGALLLYVFGGLDAYLRATHQGNARRRGAVLLNLLAPGLGYLAVGRWHSALIGIGASALCIHLSRNPSNVLDAIFVGVQLISALGVFMLQTKAELATDAGPPPLLDPHDQVPLAQLLLLGLGTAAVLLAGWSLLARTNNYGALAVRREEIRLERRAGGISVNVPRHAAELVTFGEGWSVEASFGGALFAARHELGATLLWGVEPLVPFCGKRRYLHRVQRRVEASGYTLSETQTLKLGHHEGTVLHFRRTLPNGLLLERWAVVVIRERYGYLLLIGCPQSTCKTLGTSLRNTRESMRLGPRLP